MPEKRPWSRTQSVAVPRVVGRYTIHDEIASGGLGSVRFARVIGASGFSRTVVAKLPHAHFAQLPEVGVMLSDEARLAGRIHHPNVVSILDVVQTPDELILVMEYVHGESVDRLAFAAAERCERIPLEIAASIVIDTLHGLNAAHEATDEQGRLLGIVHRDVSPQNILVGADGISRVVDFGVAFAASRLQETTNARALKGKHGYMAPEQLQGAPVTRLTDTFAAAIVLWELLTGAHLFLGHTDVETMHRCVEARVRPPSELVPGIPRAIDEILLRALSRDPADRYPTARAMALALEACVRPVRASEIGAWVEQMVGDTLRHRRAVLARIEREEAEARSTLGSVFASSGEGVGRDEATTVRTAPFSRSQAQSQSQTQPLSQSRTVSSRTLQSARTTQKDGWTEHGLAADRRRTSHRPGGMAPRICQIAWSAGAALALVCTVWLALAHGSNRASAAAANPAPAIAHAISKGCTVARSTAPAEPSQPATSSTPASADAPPAAAPITRAPSRLPATTLPSSPRPSQSTEQTQKAEPCVPPYVVDSHGHAIFKVECL
jgi:serine/threonine-protein kinase